MRTFIFEVFGDLACFSRPETKVERMSYPVMTPSAARGILDAIYAKPIEFGWRIDKIEVLKPISFFALRRNEVKDKISSAAVSKAIKNPESFPVILADATPEMVGADTKGRTQRQTIALTNVRYRIHAHIVPRFGFENHSTAIEEQAQRRINSGKCHYQPCFGCREFVAYFEPSSGQTESIPDTFDIGLMVYDVFELDKVVIDHAKPFITLFRAKLEEGVLQVPDYSSNLVLKPDTRR